MSLNALLLVLAASFTHAFWNFLAKKSNGGVAFVWLIYLSSTLLFIPFAVNAFNEVDITLSVMIMCAVSGALRLFYFIVLQAGYRNADLSVVYPLARGSAPLFTTIAALLILHEQPTTYTVSGLGLIIAGVIIISRPKFHSQENKVTTGTVYGLGTGLIIAVYTIWDKIAVDLHIAPLALTFASHVIGAFLLAPFALKQKNSIGESIVKHWWIIIAIAILSPVSYLLVLEAMRTTDVIYIAPAREVSILFGVLLGGQLMSEKDTRKRILGGCFILAGIIILSV